MTPRLDRYRHQKGQAMVEYTLALALIALAVMVGAEVLRVAWSQQMTATAGGLSAESVK